MSLLQDLKAAAEAHGDQMEFEQKLAQLCQEFKSLSNLSAKIKAARLNTV